MEYRQIFGGVAGRFGVRDNAEAKKRLSIVGRLEHSILHAAGSDVNTGFGMSLVRVMNIKDNDRWASAGVCVDGAYVLATSHGINHESGTPAKSVDMVLFEYDGGGDYGNGRAYVWPQVSKHRHAEAGYAILDRSTDFSLLYLPSGLMTLPDAVMPETLVINGSPVREGNSAVLVTHGKNGSTISIAGNVVADDLKRLSDGQNVLLSNYNRMIHPQGELAMRLQLEVPPIPGQSGSPVFDRKGSLTGLLTDRRLESCGYASDFNAVANSILGARRVLAFEKSRLEGILGYRK